MARLSAADVLRRYAAGERDFRDAGLERTNFSGALGGGSSGGPSFCSFWLR
jgi:hypothetical protein